jgi:hypothetical protein
MSRNIGPHVAGQDAALSLDELAKRIHEAQAAFMSAASNAVMHAIDAGQALIAAKNCTPHGQWGKFLKRCNVGERQAERYMRLAHLVETNPTGKSDLAGLTIETAIKKLSPPPTKERRFAHKTVAAPEAINNARVTHFNVVAAWMAASSTERKKAIDAIGLESLLAAIPDEWWPLLKERIGNRYQINGSTGMAPATLSSDDLSIPEFLRRELPGPLEVVPEAPDTDEPDEVADDEEPEPRRVRKVKLAEHSTEITDAIGCALGELQELTSEIREIVDNASERLQGTQRIQTLGSSASELENLDKPEVPAALSKIPVKYSLPKRRYSSREARARDAATILEACAQALEGITDREDCRTGAQALIVDLRCAIESIESCEFPGMYQ